MSKKPIIISLVTVAAILLVLLAGWTSVIFSKDPVNSALASVAPWPVACSAKGCITTTQWIKHHELERTYAQNTANQSPTTRATLTTLLRQHITQQSFLKSPVTRAEAKRYREDILHLTDEEQLKEVMDISLKEYDELIIMPWLQQESLRQEHDVDTNEELFSVLSQDKFIIVWPLRLTWDHNTGQITPRN